MWSLPNIIAMNARAAANRKSISHEAKLKKSVKHPCECCLKPSTVHEKYFDIFSDDAKGVRHLCQKCDEDGRGNEGYFVCDSCGRLMVENYTWEIYRRIDPDSDEVQCLSCAAERHFANPDNWIDPKLVKEVVLAPHNPRLNGNNVPLFNPATGILNVGRCRHVLGVQQPRPQGIKFLENAEFDSTDGQQISGRRLLDIIQELDEPFCPVLDAAYQFAVSIGLYVREKPSAQLRLAA